MGIDFRSCAVSDVNFLNDFVCEYYAFDGLLYDAELVREALSELICEERLGRVWLVELNQLPIGYIVLTFGFILEFHGKHAVIDEVYLRSDYRGRGYFQMALGFVETFCRDSNIRCLRLEVETRNAFAQRAYRKAGFHQHERLLMTKLLYSAARDR